MAEGKIEGVGVGIGTRVALYDEVIFKPYACMAKVRYVRFPLTSALKRLGNVETTTCSDV
jgi:hypothetical protein